MSSNIDNEAVYLSASPLLHKHASDFVNGYGFQGVLGAAAELHGHLACHRAARYIKCIKSNNAKAPGGSRYSNIHVSSILAYVENMCVSVCPCAVWCSALFDFGAATGDGARAKLLLDALPRHG